MPSTYPASDGENPDYIRHKIPLPPARAAVYGTPARWYRFHVDYIPALIALCDYYVHEDAHDGDALQKAESAARWVELQYYLMTGDIDEPGGSEVSEDTFCQKVAECIENGNLDLTIINQFNTTVREVGPDETKPDHPAAIIPIADTCDRDALFAAIRQMIDWMDELIGQFLAALSTSFNFLEQVGRVLDGFPIIGEGPMDEYIVAFSEWLEDLAIGYDASFSQDIRESYWCDLFCMAVATCSLNPREMRDYFWGRFREAFTDNSIKHIITAISSLGTQGPEVVHGLFFLCMWSITKGNAFLGVEPSQFKAIVLALSNDSDPDWAVYCDECPAHALLTFLFSDSPYSWQPFGANAGSFESGQGLTCYGHPTTSLQGVQYEWALGDAYPVTKVRVEATIKGGDVTTVSRPVWITALTDQGVKQNVVWFKANYGAVREVAVELFDCPDCRIIQVGAKVGSSLEGSFVKVTRVSVWMDAECPPTWGEFCDEIS